MLKVTHKGKELWGSSTFIAPDLGETRVDLTGEKESMALIFDFIKDKDKPQSLQMDAENETTLRVTCTNWDSPYYATLTELAHIGDFEGRHLYFLFSAVKIGSIGEIRQVTVNVYLGGNING